jgi:hypothetical protein
MEHVLKRQKIRSSRHRKLEYEPSSEESIDERINGSSGPTEQRSGTEAPLGIGHSFSPAAIIDCGVCNAGVGAAAGKEQDG